MNNQVEIEISVPSEKFSLTADTVLAQTLELLNALNALERDIYERNEKLNKEKFIAGIPYNQIAPGAKELWKEYFEQYKRLVTPVCTERLLKRGYGRSFGKPGKYDYLNTKCKIVCMMKSAQKATIEVFFHDGVDMRQQFILKNIENEWKIDEVKYGFSNETTWHTDGI